MPCVLSRSRIPNLIAGTIFAATTAVLYTNFDAVPVAGSPTRASARESSGTKEFKVPIPPDAVELPAVESNRSDTETSDTVGAAVPSALSDHELIEYWMLLLKDGADYLRQFETYTAVFHKQERISGDLSKIQNIELKIRQRPAFAVYMKWQNGDRGRQLLYSDDYADGDMVVKLGGFKGRLLPGFRLNPLGGRARSESRYPVTDCGIMGMTDQMIARRRRDLAMGHGFRCTRLPNQEFDERDCCCFLIEYDSPQVSKEYRKSLTLLDAKNHFPVLARNYIWATEIHDLSDEDLDTLTLAENYSFTSIDFAKTLTAVDFSRENPRYRM